MYHLETFAWTCLIEYHDCIWYFFSQVWSDNCWQQLDDEFQCTVQNFLYVVFKWIPLFVWNKRHEIDI